MKTMTTMLMTSSPSMPLIPDAPRAPEILSRPTTCLHCHLIVQMVYSEDRNRHDDNKGCWSCPVCNKDYPARYWKIKPARRVA